MLELVCRSSRGETEIRKSEELEKRYTMRPGHQIKKFLSLKYCIFHSLFYLTQTSAHLLHFFQAPYISSQPNAMNLHVSYEPNHCGKFKGTERKDFLISMVQGHNPWNFPMLEKKKKEEFRHYCDCISSLKKLINKRISCGFSFLYGCFIDQSWAPIPLKIKPAVLKIFIVCSSASDPQWTS